MGVINELGSIRYRCQSDTKWEKNGCENPWKYERFKRKVEGGTPGQRQAA